MASETFAPQGFLRPDWSAPGNWSGGSVPADGTVAVVNGLAAWIDPQTQLSASIVLEGGAAIIGNGGGFSFLLGSSVQAEDSNALYADGAIINDGVITATGPGAALNIVVQAGADIAALYGLQVPSFENTGTVIISGGAVLEINGTELSNTGTILADGGAVIVAGGWVDGGQNALPRSGEIGLSRSGEIGLSRSGEIGLSPGGVIGISAGGDAAFGDGVVDQIFSFSGPGTIAFGDPADVSDVAVAGYGFGDEILTSTMAQAESLLADGLNFSTPLPANARLAVREINGGAEIFLQEIYTPPCFARGARILTPGGYLPVEQIKPGGTVVTANGVISNVGWVGRRRIDLATHSRPETVRPIRIMRNAVADGVPARDLRLSPDHALFLDGHLVPVKLLVNGATIIRETSCLAVTYFHIELDCHDILLAENLNVESYLDTGNRGVFENAGGQPWRSPALGRGKQWDSRACAPLCIGGRILHNIRQNLLDRVEARGYLRQILPGIHLWVDGQRIDRTFGVTSLPCFELRPNHSGIISIRSARFVPAEMSAGTESGDDDWRSLGVAIRRVKIDLKSVQALEIAQAGFHPRGAGDIADWTDGNGVIRIPRETSVLGLNICALPKGWQAPLGAVSIG